MSKYWKSLAAAFGAAQGALIVATTDTGTPGVVTREEGIGIAITVAVAALSTLAAPKNAVKDGEV